MKMSKLGPSGKLGNPLIGHGGIKTKMADVASNETIDLKPRGQGGIIIIFPIIPVTQWDLVHFIQVYFTDS